MTHSTEDYLEVIAALNEVAGHAHVSEIAERLGISKPSVTAALRLLADEGLVTYMQYQPVQLTPKGVRRAETIIRKHQALSHLLSEHLKLDAAHADALACKFEHELDEVAFDRLNEFIKFKTLDALAAGERGEIVRISPELDRKRLASLGMVKGVLVTPVKTAPLGDPRSYLVDNTEISLRAAQAKKITLKLV